MSHYYFSNLRTSFHFSSLHLCPLLKSMETQRKIWHLLHWNHLPLSSVCTDRQCQPCPLNSDPMVIVCAPCTVLLWHSRLVSLLLYLAHGIKTFRELMSLRHWMDHAAYVIYSHSPYFKSIMIIVRLVTGFSPAPNRILSIDCFACWLMKVDEHVITLTAVNLKRFQAQMSDSIMGQ